MSRFDQLADLGHGSRSHRHHRAHSDVSFRFDWNVLKCSQIVKVCVYVLLGDLCLVAWLLGGWFSLVGLMVGWLAGTSQSLAPACVCRHPETIVTLPVTPLPLPFRTAPFMPNPNTHTHTHITWSLGNMSVLSWSVHRNDTHKMNEHELNQT